MEDFRKFVQECGVTRLYISDLKQLILTRNLSINTFYSQMQERVPLSYFTPLVSENRQLGPQQLLYKQVHSVFAFASQNTCHYFQANPQTLNKIL